MMPKRSRFRRQMIMIGSMAGSTSDLVQGLWRSGGSKRWMIPLAVFLCMTGVILVAAVSVQGLAPFVYAIF
jgi:hypothetical protein